ncbi:MAG: redoxin domain-containing protein [Bacteroidales bacterium]|nr:redoxin domain-containing protein [Bacteroidales bacterium]
MKKALWTAAAALMALIGCANAPVEQKIKDFQSEIENYEKAFSEELVTIKQNADLTAEQQQEAVNLLQEKVAGQIKDFCKTTIRKNKNDGAGLEALKYAYYFFDVDEQEELLGCLGPKVKEDDFVQKALQSVQAKKSTKAGQPFVDFTIVQDPDNAEASTVRLSDYAGKGKYLLVDFWASWCGPCKAELPNIKAVYDKYAGEDFDVLSVAVWDKPEDTAKAAAELGITWHQIVNAQQVPTDLYGIEGIPHIILIGPDGIILNRDLRGEGIEAAVSRNVKAKH